MDAILAIFILYTVILLVISVYSYRVTEKAPAEEFAEEFYAAGRGFGAIIVALLIGASLASSGTFIAGPGMTYTHGFSWLMMNNAQNFMLLTTLGFAGIAIGVAARSTGSSTYLDLFMNRYESKWLVGILAVLITVFLVPYISTQFVGAARVLNQMTGVGYEVGLALGALIVLVYMAAGGIRGAALTNLVQGAAMTVGVVIMLIGTIRYAGGVETAVNELSQISPAHLSPTRGGVFGPEFGLSVFFLVGFFTIGMPHSVLGGLTYKSSKSLKRAIWIGGILVTLWTVFLCFSGVLTYAINPELVSGDSAAPWLATNVVPDWAGGIMLAGLIGGIQTTVGGMSVIITSSIAKNLAEIVKPDIQPSTSKKISRITMIIVIGAAILIALNPPELIQWVILFSIGGLQSATFGPLMLGLFWRRTNKYGAIAGAIIGTITYGLFSEVWPATEIFGFHQVMIGVPVSVAVTIIISLATEKPSRSVIEQFFGKPKPKEKVSE